MKIDLSLLPNIVENLRNRRMRKAIAAGGLDVRWNFGKAIARGNTQIVKKFLELGASADDPILGPFPGDEKGYRFHTKPMWLAAQWKQPVVMGLLLASGGTVDGDTMDHAISELDANDPASIHTVASLIAHGCDFPGYIGDGTGCFTQSPIERRLAITQHIQKTHPGVHEGLIWIQAEIQRQTLERDTIAVKEAIPRRQPRL